jgi:hypothetical protein
MVREVFGRKPRDLLIAHQDAAAQASRLGRPGLAPWPEQLLGLLAEFGSRLEAAPR